MNILLKLFGGMIIASAISVFVGALSLFILKYIVDVNQLNHGKDAYWVFSYAFYAMIISWVLSFGFSLILLDK